MLVPGWKKPWGPLNPRNRDVDERTLVAGAEASEASGGLTVCRSSSGQHCTCYLAGKGECCRCGLKPEVEPS
jgi:hypothetical protein